MSEQRWKFLRGDGYRWYLVPAELSAGFEELLGDGRIFDFELRFADMRISYDPSLYTFTDPRLDTSW